MNHHLLETNKHHSHDTKSLYKLVQLLITDNGGDKTKYLYNISIIHSRSILYQDGTLMSFCDRILLNKDDTTALEVISFEL